MTIWFDDLLLKYDMMILFSGNFSGFRIFPGFPGISSNLQISTLFIDAFIWYASQIKYDHFIFRKFFRFPDTSCFSRFFLWIFRFQPFLSMPSDRFRWDTAKIWFFQNLSIFFPYFSVFSRIPLGTLSNFLQIFQLYHFWSYFFKISMMSEIWW